jgi:enoyl-CoA hydratase
MSDVEYEVDGAVARLTLNRPERCNGITRRLVTELERVFDGIARHTKEGYAFQALAAREGFRTAVCERYAPFGDWG